MTTDTQRAAFEALADDLLAQCDEAGIRRAFAAVLDAFDKLAKELAESQASEAESLAMYRSSRDRADAARGTAEQVWRDALEEAAMIADRTAPRVARSIRLHAEHYVPPAPETPRTTDEAVYRCPRCGQEAPEPAWCVACSGEAVTMEHIAPRTMAAQADALTIARKMLPAHRDLETVYARGYRHGVSDVINALEESASPAPQAVRDEAQEVSERERALEAALVEIRDSTVYCDRMTLIGIAARTLEPRAAARDGEAG